MKTYQLLRDHIYKEGILTKQKSFKRDEFLKVQGTRDTNIYFITSGSVKVFFTNKEEEHILYFGYKNSIITAIDSFLSNTNSKLEIKALKKTTVFYLTKEEFNDFLDRNPEYLKLWNEILQEIILYQFEREKDLLLTSPEERYYKALERNSELFQEIPHKHIANYLRMASETLSRIKKS